MGSGNSMIKFALLGLRLKRHLTCNEGKPGEKFSGGKYNLQGVAVCELGWRLLWSLLEREAKWDVENVHPATSHPKRHGAQQGGRRRRWWGRRWRRRKTRRRRRGRRKRRRRSQPVRPISYCLPSQPVHCWHPTGASHTSLVMILCKPFFTIKVHNKSILLNQSILNNQSTSQFKYQN